jgi:hypothetical protein
VVYSYALVTLLAVALVWSANVFELVTYASRAFAFYYLLQTVAALVVASRIREGRWRLRLLLFSAVAVILLLIVLFAVPAESAG